MIRKSDAKSGRTFDGKACHPDMNFPADLFFKECKANYGRREIS